MKKYWYVIPIILIVIVLGLVFTVNDKKDSSEASGDTGTDTSTDVENYVPEEDMEGIDNGIVFDEELEDAVLTFKEAPEEDFYGSWEATSGQAVFMYNTVQIEVKKDGTWKGRIVDEDLNGTWTFDGQDMSLTSDLFEAKLSFTDDGKLIMREDREGNGDYINTVLTKR